MGQIQIKFFSSTDQIPNSTKIKIYNQPFEERCLHV